MKITKKIIARIAAAVLLLLFAGFACFMHTDGEMFELTMKICTEGWAGNLSYDMLSDKLKTLVSEEEFNDTSPEGRLNVYRKFGSQSQNERTGSRIVSTDGYRTTPGDGFDIGETHYTVFYNVYFEYIMGGIFGAKAVNFSVYIEESEISESAE